MALKKETQPNKLNYKYKTFDIWQIEYTCRLHYNDAVIIYILFDDQEVL